MRYIVRGALVSILSACLATLPVVAAPNAVIGFVIQTQAARLDGTSLLSMTGTTVFAGDILQTDAHGFIRIRVTANQLHLNELSEAKLEGDSTNATLVLTHGTAAFASSHGGGIAIRALDVIVRPKTPVNTVAQVEVADPDRLYVSCSIAPLELEIDGKVYPLAPGHTYAVTIQGQGLQSVDAGQHPARNRRGLVIFLAGAAAAGLGALILQHQVSESPFKP